MTALWGIHTHNFCYCACSGKSPHKAKGKKMATLYKVRQNDEMVAQFSSATLATHFVKSIPNFNFVINYDNRKVLWDTAKEGTPNLAEILNRANSYKAKRKAKYEATIAELRELAEKTSKGIA